MQFNIYEGLSEEYREYRIVQPEQLNFRPASNEAELAAMGALSNNSKKGGIIMIAVGGALVLLGALALTQSSGGALLILFGLIPAVIGIIKLTAGTPKKLIATGTLLHKESQSTGTINNHSRHTFRRLVIDVDGMDKTLCMVRVAPEDYDGLFEGDKVLVLKDAATYRGKKLR